MSVDWVSDAWVSANAGTVNGKDWAQWDPVKYVDMLPNVLRFVHAGKSKIIDWDYAYD